MSERKFIPVNQAAIESSNAVSFGAYRQNTTWKSTGQPSDHLIEMTDDRKLTFSGANYNLIDQNISEWNESFKILDKGEAVPIRGFVHPRIEISGSLKIQPYFNNSTLVATGLPITELIIDGTTSIPVGFYCYLTSEDGVIFKIKPEYYVQISAFKTNLTNNLYTSASSVVPQILNYSAPLLIKVGALFWSIAYVTVSEAAV